MAQAQGICIIAEANEGGKPTPLTLELMGLGDRLAFSLGEQLYAVVLGSGIRSTAEELANSGAVEIQFLDHTGLSEYNPDAYLPVLVKLFEQRAPKVILAGHTSLGQDLAPRLAFALEAGLMTDCVAVEVDPSGSVSFTRPVYGGNALATQKALTAIAVSTVRARVGEPPATSGDRGAVTPLATEVPVQTRIELKGREREEAGECPLEEARAVISGGRGMGGEDGFDQLRELASILGGAVGASRPPVDSGWTPTTCQVGITGKVVAPDIYIAVAISGSSQHLSGMGESGKIVAINKDPEAYIFKVSDYGVVGDWKQVLPSFAAKLKELVSE